MRRKHAPTLREMSPNILSIESIAAVAAMEAAILHYGVYNARPFGLVQQHRQHEFYVELADPILLCSSQIGQTRRLPSW